MKPEKLFDYLDGTLPAAEREELERNFATDSHLQRELSIARDMHKRMRGSREVLGASDAFLPPQSAALGRRVATAFAVLVLVNVGVGIAFIVGKHREKPPDLRMKEAAIRQQLLSSLQKTAEQAIPAPSFAGSEIILVAAAEKRGAIANSIILFAGQCGGSATKALPNEKTITVLVDIPSAREEEFRRSVAPLAEAMSFPPALEKKAASPGPRTFIQVRIGDARDFAAPPPR